MPGGSVRFDKVGLSICFTVPVRLSTFAPFSRQMLLEVCPPKRPKLRHILPLPIRRGLWWRSL
jgi:hypothetical protein